VRIRYQLFGIHASGVPAEGDLTLPDGSRACALAAALGISTSVCIYVRNGRTCRDDEPLSEGDRLRLVGPVDGGS
jgi:sulfur carrier protein ThiS